MASDPRPPQWLAGSRFPDPRSAPGDMPVAWGGDLSPETLLDAYRHGIFPWPEGDRALLWWSPDPRAVIPLDGLRVTRSLRRSVRRYRTTRDTAFARVVRGCADREEGTWITAGMTAAYERLHALGFAHSVEVWDAAGALVGGLYGVTVGAAFAGESMFTRATDASKVAVVRLVEHLGEQGFTLLDVQLPTAHLASLGAVAIPREEFLDRLAAAVISPARFLPS